MELPPGVELVELAPLSRRRKTLPEWAVKLDGRRIGRIETHQLSGARNLFYFAWGVYPADGREVRLEGDTDLAARVRVVVAFWRDPNTAIQHLGGHRGA